LARTRNVSLTTHPPRLVKIRVNVSL